MQFLSISKQNQREWGDGCCRTAVHVMFTQMGEKQETKELKEWDVAAIVKEYKQHHEINMFVRVCTGDLTPKQN